MWKTIYFNTDYEVSDSGQVRRIYKNHTRLMKSQVDKDGYLYVKLYDSSTKTYARCRIHRLVLSAFTRLPKEKEEVHHINGQRDDNRLENLQWTTRQENDSFVVHPYNKTSYEKRPVAQVSLLTGEDIQTFETVSEAAKAINGNVGHICSVCKGDRKSHLGFFWRYLD